MALEHPRDPSTRRVVARVLFLVVPLVGAAIAAPLVYGKIRPGPPVKPPDAPTAEQLEAARDAAKRLADAERGYEKVQIITPGTPPAPGVEETAPFEGFGLSLESEPEGASVAVDGRAMGETPFLAGVRCDPGSTVRIVLTRDRFKPRELATRCRADTLVKLRVRLEP